MATKNTLSNSVLATAASMMIAVSAQAKGKPEVPEQLTFENAYHADECYATYPGTTAFVIGVEVSRDTEGYIVSSCLDDRLTLNVAPYGVRYI